MGRTPQEELFRLRVEAAQYRLSSGGDPIYAIAVESGFRHSDDLAKHFRRHVDMTPSEYRVAFRVG